MLGKIRAKFVADPIVALPDGSFEIVMEPVTSGSEENKSFSKYTPSGRLNLRVDNPAVDGFFRFNEAYYLDIMPAETPGSSSSPNKSGLSEKGFGAMSWPEDVPLPTSEEISSYLKEIGFKE